MRYFIEVAYHGHGYAGFQVQENAHTIQAEVENALHILTRQHISLTGSSRTDAGVHARQNYFHFDSDIAFTDKQTYNLNAILPKSICVLSVKQMAETAHSRFDAMGRLYKFYIYHSKNPFCNDRAWFYPYPLDIQVLNNVAGLLLGTHDFTSFSKRNTQVKTMICTLAQSHWNYDGDMLVYTVQGNRFLRGMVRGLVATMLRAGRGVITVEDFAQILAAQDCAKADFSAPGHGLFLEKVIYEEGYFG